MSSSRQIRKYQLGSAKKVASLHRTLYFYKESSGGWVLAFLSIISIIGSIVAVSIIYKKLNKKPPDSVLEPLEKGVQKNLVIVQKVAPDSVKEFMGVISKELSSIKNLTPQKAYEYLENLLEFLKKEIKSGKLEETELASLQEVSKKVTQIKDGILKMVQMKEGIKSFSDLKGLLSLDAAKNLFKALPKSDIKALPMKG